MRYGLFLLPRWLAIPCIDCAGQGVVNPAFVCNANAGVPPVVRSEGITEFVGDLILQCTGGNPTPIGQPIPTSDLRLTLNTNLTSRLLNPAGGAVEAMLLLDEPGAPNKATQLVCGGPGSNVNVNGACPVPGNGTGVNIYD